MAIDPTGKKKGRDNKRAQKRQGLERANAFRRGLTVLKVGTVLRPEKQKKK